MIISAELLSVQSGCSCFDMNDGGFNPRRLVQLAGAVTARRVPLYGESRSRPGALCNSGKRAATERGALFRAATQRCNYTACDKVGRERGRGLTPGDRAHPRGRKFVSVRFLLGVRD